jgi:hypothetical protein
MPKKLRKKPIDFRIHSDEIYLSTLKTTTKCNINPSP